MAKKVYVVMEHYFSGPSNVVAVFTSLEEAKVCDDFLRERTLLFTYPVSYYIIEECYLNPRLETL